jgi:predicted NUDIX family NTP pyrophosphohydrolase
MPKLSAALLVHKVNDQGVVEVLIVHPGGPYWAKKDAGAWSIPKGEYEEGDDPQAVAYREFEEELGLSPPSGVAIALGEIRQPSGKRVTTWTVECDELDVSEAHSNEFEMEWPRGSGNVQRFPEVDRAGWFSVRDAREKLLNGHTGFLDRLMGHLSESENRQLREAPADQAERQGQLF